MNYTDHDIDAVVHNALTAEVADVHADDTLLERIRHEAASTQPRTRRAVRAPWAAVAAVALIVCGVGAAVVLGGPDETPVTAGPADDMGEGANSSTPESAGFEVLVVQATIEPMGSLHAAVDEEGLSRLWSEVGFEADPPDVDFARRVVVAQTVPGGGCPTEVTGIERSGGVVEVLFEDVIPEGVDGCTMNLVTRALVVAIDRQGLAPSFTLTLPANDTYGYEEQRLVVEVPASAEDGAPTALGEPGTISGTTATGNSWELAVDGPVPCLSVQVRRAAPVSACLGDALSTDDPHRVGLLDDGRVPRFVFGVAPPGTAAVSVRLMDGVRAEGSLDDGSVAAADGTMYYAVELPGRADGALVEFLGADGTRLSRRLVSGAADAPFTLVISNQSFKKPDVAITVRIDGKEIVSDVFRVEGQHTFTRFPMDLAAGDHLLEAETDDGITVSSSFTVPADKPYFGTLFYWYEDGAHSVPRPARPLPEEGYFELNFSDQEFAGD